jgi:hypothetical protein
MQVKYVKLAALAVSFGIYSSNQLVIVKTRQTKIVKFPFSLWHLAFYFVIVTENLKQAFC